MLGRQPKANTPAEAFNTLAKELKSVEDAYSGVPYDPNVGISTGGRMYAPKADNISQYPDGSWFLKSRGHRMFFNKDGGVTIINRTTGKVDFQDGPQLPPPIYTEDGSD